MTVDYTIAKKCVEVFVLQARQANHQLVDNLRTDRAGMSDVELFVLHMDRHRASAVRDTMIRSAREIAATIPEGA